jgi:hypothetical protein
MKYVALALGVALFGWLVWPTLYRYDHETLGTRQASETLLVRINRLTGDTEVLGPHGWSRPLSPQAVPSEGLTKVIITTASFDDSQNLVGNVYNGSDWTLTSLTFRVIAKRLLPGKGLEDATLVWDRQFRDDDVYVTPLAASTFRVRIGEDLEPRTSPPGSSLDFSRICFQLPGTPADCPVRGTWSIVAGRGTRAAR